MAGFYYMTTLRSVERFSRTVTQPVVYGARFGMLIDYMRVSKADGSQVFNLQRDALLAAGVTPRYLYEDHASGKRDERPGLEDCLKSLRKGDTLVA